MRNFVYRDIDTLAACPQMFYRDSAKPYVGAWFACSEGADPASFVRTIGDVQQDRLEADGGLCIMYTHLGAGFWRDGALDPEFERLMRKLAGRDGWFAPVAEVLDHLRSVKGVTDLGARERRELEWRWLGEKARALDVVTDREWLARSHSATARSLVFPDRSCLRAQPA